MLNPSGISKRQKNKKYNTLGARYALVLFQVDASADVLGFLLAAGGLLTTPDSRFLSHLLGSKP